MRVGGNLIALESVAVSKNSSIAGPTASRRYCKYALPLFGVAFSLALERLASECRDPLY